MATTKLMYTCALFFVVYFCLYFGFVHGGGMEPRSALLGIVTLNFGYFGLAFGMFASRGKLEDYGIAWANLVILVGIVLACYPKPVTFLFVLPIFAGDMAAGFRKGQVVEHYILLFLVHLATVASTYGVVRLVV